jgi:PAS domain S-box-containing protein
MLGTQTGDPFESRRALEESGGVRYLEAALEEVRDAVVVTGGDERVAFWNAGADRLFRIDARAALGRRFSELVQPRWLNPEQEALGRASLAREGRWKGERVHVLGEGRELPVETTLRVLRDERGATQGLLVVSRELPAPVPLPASPEPRLRALFEGLELALALGRVAVEGDAPVDLILEEVNEAFETYTGLQSAQMLGRRVTEVLPDLFLAPDSPLALLLDVASTGLPRHFTRTSPRTGRCYAAKAFRSEPGRVALAFDDLSSLSEVQRRLRESEERFRRVVDQLPDSLLLYDAERRVQVANQASQRLSGKSADELLGRRDEEIWPREHVARFLPHLERALATGEAQRLEMPSLRPGGSEVVTFVPLLDEAGKVCHVVSVSHDISHRKRAEEAARRSEVEAQRRSAELAAVFDALDEPVLVFDASGAVTAANAATRALFGLDLVRLDAQAYCDLIRARLRPLHGPCAESEALPSRRALAGETVRAEVFRLTDASGAERIVEVSAIPLLIDGHIVGSVAASHDVSQRQRAEDALRESEELFRTLAENLPDAIARFDRANRFLYANLAHRRAAWLPGDLLRRPDPQVELACERLEKLTALSERVFATGRPDSLELTLQTPEGARHFETRLFPELAPDGEVRSVLSLSREVTERRRAEEALRESEQTLRLALDAAKMAMWSWDLDSGEMVWSQRCTALFPENAVTYERLIAAIHPEDRDRIAAAVAATLERGEDYDVEMRVPWPGGDIHWVAAKGRAFFDSGRCVRMAGMALDVTERKRGEEALRAAKEQLELADQRKNAFLAMLSHELRNPLAPIRNSLYVLGQSRPDSDPARRAQQIIERQVTQLTRLVDDLLDVTRIARGKVRLQRQRLDLGRLARRVAEDHRSVFARSGLELELQVGEAPLWVWGDPMRLAQVMGNLLNNAAKFTPRGGKATLAVERTGPGFASIRVRDTGVGVAPEALAHLFEPFVQARETLSRSGGGLGLGLALVKGLVDQHGGEVRVHSDGPGHGAEFVVQLPLEAEGEQPEAPSPAIPRGTTRRVLLIEDNEDAAESLKAALELGGHTVELAFDGADGLEKARRFRPDAVLCDLGLPGMDGYQVARSLRADPALRGLFLVALSGFASPEDVERSRQAGFDRHVAKPPDPKELEQLLAAAPGMS